MELSDNQEAELRRIVQNNPRGIQVDAFYEKTSEFVDQKEFLLGLHTARQQGWLYKSGNMYFLTDAEIPPDVVLPADTTTVRKAAKSLRHSMPYLGTEEVRAATQVLMKAEKPSEPKLAEPMTAIEDAWAGARAKFAAEAESLAKTSSGQPTPSESVEEKSADCVHEPAPELPQVEKVDPEESNLPGSKGFGNLRRRSVPGRAALALFKFRNEPALSLDQLLEITGDPKVNLSQSMFRLCPDGFAYKDDRVFRRPLFKWTGLYKYPFSTMLPEDSELLKFNSVKEYRDSKLPPSMRETSTPVAESVGACSESLGSPASVKVAENPPAARPAWPSSDTAGFQASPMPSLANIDAVVRQMDFEIASHKRQLETLTRMRSLLVPAEAV